MPAASPIIDEKKLRSWKLLDDFRRRLAKIRAEMPPPPERHPGGPERLLLEEEYFMLQALTGKRPGKRAMELIQMYLMGYGHDKKHCAKSSGLLSNPQ